MRSCRHGLHDPQKGHGMSETHREAFLRLLTVDSDTHDRRRKTHNQAIFMPEAEGGRSMWSSTDLEMVLSKYDRASKVTA